MADFRALCAAIVSASDAVEHDASAAEGDFLAAIDNARAALAQAEPVAADAGELVAALKVIHKMQQEWVLLGNDDDGAASPSLSMPISLRRFTVLRDALTFAATLLLQLSAPAQSTQDPATTR